MERIQKNERKIIQQLKIYLKKNFPSNSFRLLLFGSKARGDYSSNSDTDVALIMNGLTDKMQRKIYDFVSGLEVNYLTFISFIAFSEENFNFLKHRERRIALDIEKEGIPL